MYFKFFYSFSFSIFLSHNFSLPSKFPTLRKNRGNNRGNIGIKTEKRLSWHENRLYGVLFMHNRNLSYILFHFSILSEDQKLYCNQDLNLYTIAKSPCCGSFAFPCF